MRKRLSVVSAVFCVFSLCVCLSSCSSETTATPAADGSEATTTSSPESGGQVAGDTEDAESLMVYCGAGMKAPMDEIGVAFEQKYGVAIAYNYTGSGAQLSQMELTQEGDAFMPGAAMYLDTAEDKGFVAYRQNVAYHIPVITVPKGNPADITCLQDLATPGIKLVWGDPEVAAIGKTGVEILKNAGVYDAVWANVVATFPTMNEVMMQISLGQADASVNWWDTVKYDENVEVVEIPKEINAIKLIPIGSLSFSNYPVTAKQFVDFCVSDEGKAIFEKHGFVTFPDTQYEK